MFQARILYYFIQFLKLQDLLELSSANHQLCFLHTQLPNVASYHIQPSYAHIYYDQSANT